MSVSDFTSSMTVPLKSGVHAPADLVGRERSMGALHISLKVFVGPL